MISVDGQSKNYKYDALGRKISCNNSCYFYSVDQMLEEQTNDEIISYIYGNKTDEILVMAKNGNKFYYHTNHLGSITSITNSSSTEVCKIDYDVFGMPTVGDNDISSRFYFSGREYDEESGTYYFRTRDYAPNLGRFNQKDILIFEDGMNDFAYVKNRVLLYTDLFGLAGLSIGGCGDKNICDIYPWLPWCKKDECEKKSREM